MNLIFIYGPPAAGKLTVANELAKKINYRVFLNHTLVWAVASVFPYEDNVEMGRRKISETRNALARKFRIEIFEEAANTGTSVITTYGGGGSRFDFFEELEKIISAAGGNVLFVQLNPSEEALLSRVESESRKGQKIDSKKLLEKKLSEHDYTVKYSKKKHLTVDNSDMKPGEVAEKIVEYYKL